MAGVGRYTRPPVVVTHVYPVQQLTERDDFVVVVEGRGSALIVVVLVIHV